MNDNPLEENDDDPESTIPEKIEAELAELVRLDKQNARSYKELRSIIAKLETKVDLFEAELVHLNEMLVQYGFANGIEGLTKSLNEILNSDESPSEDSEENK